MAISVLPAPVTSSINANAITATTADTMYEGIVTLDPAIYTITCASATITNIQFFSGVSTLITSAVTASGTVSINLASAADRVRLWTDTGSNVVVTITKTASAMSNVFSGTLDTVTSTGTYTGTSTSGYGYAVLVGGGGAGGSCTSGGSERSGGGGGSGGVGGKFVQLTGSMSVTIGAAGTATAGQAGAAGGNSSFGGITANGGGGGALGNSNGAESAGGAGGTVTGADISSTGATGGKGNGFPTSLNNGSATTEIYSFVKTGTTGSGGGGGYDNPGTGAGSGIGTGGNGSNASNPTAGTGYGAGGGGAGNRQTTSAYTGANGTAGVLYVLRF
jgi:hypothetical protein